MNPRLEQVLSGQEDNYLLPFIWQRGEDEAVIREEMARIQASGIRAVCVEARPHPDFLGEHWWRDMDVIMEEARRRGMRVWVLDDDHFPTGHAAGKVADAPPELRRLFLHEHHMDVLGPQQNTSLLVKPWFANLFNPGVEQGAALLAVIAARRTPASETLTGEFIDLTGLIQNGILYWDIPEGVWRVFYLITSPSGGSERHQDYLNPLESASVKILLDAVYEPFYARYRADFGHTFAGFFSDEPGFYNDRESFDYNSKLGKKGVALPWRADLLELLEAQAGEGSQPLRPQPLRLLLPLLWHEGGEATARVRSTYMDVVSRLYGQHFTQQLGDWCRSRGAEYIGHVLEDNGVHTRLGCGAGHFFRALWGQDMAGIDVVLWQLMPGFDQGPFTNVSGEGDGEFYHYGLAKLASSLAHIDPKKKGRAMCEIFGAFGWREGLKLMKWMTDHMLVRGVNTFVPHAFSQAEFPDFDCPPHFYARGKNPQYRYYSLLNHYTNRISHLLTGGQHVASAAVLYHAEAEWSGAAMPFQTAARELMQHQLDCDVLPGDALLAAPPVMDGRLRVADESYPCLIIPTSEALPAALLGCLDELAAQGLPLLFVNALPVRASEGAAAGAAALVRLAQREGVHVVGLAELAGRVRAMGFYEVSVTSHQPALRHYHAAHPGLDVYMFFNEHPYDHIETQVRLPARGEALAYDAFANRLFQLDSVTAQGELTFTLRLSPYESTLVLTGEGARGLPAAHRPTPGEQEQPLNGPWAVSTATAEQYPAFAHWKQLTTLADLSRADALPNFSGTLRYETAFAWDHPGGSVFLDLGSAYETAEVWVNGQPAGVRLCPPYQYEISELLRGGQNRLVVEVTNTLAKDQQDFLSRFTQQEPSGLLGPVRLRYNG